MPSSSTNTTNTSSSGNATHVSSHPATNRTNTSTANWHDPASNLGYGVGRLLRGAFDLASSAWQNWWNPNSRPSPEQIAQRQQRIYIAGLKECIQHLVTVLENVRKNPHDPASLGKVDVLAQHYAAYVNVHPTMEWHLLQQEFFQPIHQQIERFTDSSLKRKLKILLPVLTMDSSKQENKKIDSSIKKDESVQTDGYDLVLSQSYYYEENYVKRAIQQQPFPTVFDLNTLDGSNGFVIDGLLAGVQLGATLSASGDINGDGEDDLVLGAIYSAPNNRINAGTVYVLFGQANGWPAQFNLSSLNGTNGFAVEGLLAGGELGYSTDIAGDLNSDGKSDLVVGACYASPGNRSQAGVVYVLFGQANWPARFDLTSLNGSNGFVIEGPAVDTYLGIGVGGVGDINGDGKVDLVLGASAFDASTRGVNSSGTVYILFAQSGGWSAQFNLSSLNGTNGFSIEGLATGDALGNSVRNIGDINGDGKVDLMLGAWKASPGNRTQAGAAYVLFGQASSWPTRFDLTTLNGSNGFMVEGLFAGDSLGYAFSTAGDINGDGKTDIVLGAWQASPGNRAYAGAVYVIFGQASDWPTRFDLMTLNGSNGFMVEGLLAGDNLGYSVSIAGDINGDGKADIVLGGLTLSPSNRTRAGVVYILFGQASDWPARFNLTTLNGINGFFILGSAGYDYLGNAVSIADMNWDGKSDLILGAYGASPGNRTNAGSVYVIFGKSLVVAESCPLNQPLQWFYHNIQINQGQNLRLTPNDLSLNCGNNTVLNLGTAFTVTGITHAQFQTRNNSGFWNNASSFLGSDLSQGNVAFMQDNSTFAPELNISVTDGKTTLNSSVNIQFNTNQSIPQIMNIAFTINATGTTRLNASQFQMTDTGSKLDNVVISISASQGGYFSTTNDPTQPITDFTYYQLQAGQIQFVHNTTVLPNVTFAIGDGSSQPVLFSPLISFFDTNNSASPSVVPIAAVVGSTVGALAAIGLGVFGIFKYRQHQEQEENAVQSAGQRLR